MRMKTASILLKVVLVLCVLLSLAVVFWMLPLYMAHVAAAIVFYVLAAMLDNAVRFKQDNDLTI